MISKPKALRKQKDIIKGVAFTYNIIGGGISFILNVVFYD